MELTYKPAFLRKFKKLSPRLQGEVRDALELFCDSIHHPKLHVHKLHGKLSGHLSFSVNYRYRVVFRWEKEDVSAVLITIGDHSVYD